MSTAPRTSHHWSSGGERYREREKHWSTMYLIVNQTSRGAVLKALEKQPRDGMKSIKGLPVAFSRHLELTLTDKQAVEIHDSTACKSMFVFALPIISLFGVYSSNTYPSTTESIVCKSISLVLFVCTSNFMLTFTSWFFSSCVVSSVNIALIGFTLSVNNSFWHCLLVSLSVRSYSV